MADELAPSRRRQTTTDYKSEKQNNSSLCHFRATVMIFEQLKYSFSGYWTYVAKIKAIFVRDTHQVLKFYLIFGSSS